MPKLKLQKGKFYAIEDGERVLKKPGEMCNLTDAQAEAFADMFKAPVEPATPAKELKEEPKADTSKVPSKADTKPASAPVGTKPSAQAK